MNQDWNNIADSLRHEIAGYGGLLHLFEQQQQHLFAREADHVLRLSGDIEKQAQALHDCRRRREELITQLAVAHSQPAASTLRALLPLFSPDFRPLIEALLNEVNVLIHRVRRASRHNRTLLARAVETHQQMLCALRPDTFTQTYAPNGRSTLSAVRPVPALQSAG